MSEKQIETSLGLVSYFLGFAIIYLVFTYISLEPNPLEWLDITRFWSLVFGTGLGVLIRKGSAW